MNLKNFPCDSASVHCQKFYWQLEVREVTHCSGVVEEVTNSPDTCKQPQSSQVEVERVIRGQIVLLREYIPIREINEGSWEDDGSLVKEHLTRRPWVGSQSHMAAPNHLSLQVQELWYLLQASGDTADKRHAYMLIGKILIHIEKYLKF